MSGIWAFRNFHEKREKANSHRKQWVQ